MIADKPLNVRCAEALGWECRLRSTDHGAKPRWEGIPPGGSWAWGGESIRPYGDGTPAGWACTGPLVDRFGLSVSRGVSYPGGPYIYAWRHGADRAPRVANTSAAVAEWVALHVENGKVKP